MLQRFPGRFLDEIDEGMDWFRLLRAVEAEHIERVEDRRDMHNKKQIKAKDISQADWDSILEHDQIVAEWGSDGVDQ